MLIVAAIGGVVLFARNRRGHKRGGVGR
jgi:hypothetical protein